MRPLGLMHKDVLETEPRICVIGTVKQSFSGECIFLRWKIHVTLGCFCNISAADKEVMGNCWLQRGHIYVLTQHRSVVSTLMSSNV